jgi:hypothetical protein
MQHLHEHLLLYVNLDTFSATFFAKVAKFFSHDIITSFQDKNIIYNSNQVKIFQSVLYYMVTKHNMHSEAKTNSMPGIVDSNNSIKKLTTQDYKKMLQDRLYELESESMPAT